MSEKQPDPIQQILDGHATIDSFSGDARQAVCDRTDQLLLTKQPGEQAAYARLVDQPDGAMQPRRLGQLGGRLRIADDFDDPALNAAIAEDFYR